MVSWNARYHGMPGLPLANRTDVQVKRAAEAVSAVFTRFRL